jgi:hypothetical protein
MTPEEFKRYQEGAKAQNEVKAETVKKDKKDTTKGEKK